MKYSQIQLSLPSSLWYSCFLWRQYFDADGGLPCGLHCTVVVVFVLDAMSLVGSSLVSLGVVTDHDPSALFTIQLDPYIFLA